MAEALHLTKADAGLIASANFAGYLFGALVASLPLPGHKRSWMIGSLAMSALTSGAMSIAGGLSWFLAMRFVGGAASAFVLVFSSLVFSSTLILERLNRTGRNELAAVHFAGVGVGIAASAAVTWLSTHWFTDNWQAMWIGGSVLTIASTILVLWLVPASSDAPEPAKAETKAQSISLFWPLIAAYGLFGFGYVITATFIVAMVRSLPDAQMIEPFVWLVVGIFAIPSVAAWSWSLPRACLKLGVWCSALCRRQPLDC
jgi:MFS family permease